MRTFWIKKKKTTLYLYWKTYGSGRHCFGAMETSVLHQVYLNSRQLSNFQWCKRGSLHKVPNLNVFTHVLYQHHMLNEQQVLLPTFIIGNMSTLFIKNNQFKIACKAILCPWDSPCKNTGVGCHAPPPRGSSQPRDQTLVSCIAGRFFTVWAIRETQRLLESWEAEKSQSGFFPPLK